MRQAVRRVVLSGDARKLLESHLDSVEKLEVMRLLQRAGRAVARSELARDPSFDRESLRGAIDDLVRAELLQAGAAGLDRDAVRLGPRTAGVAFEEVMRIYDEDRALVVSTLASLSVERIRGMAARAFGEALATKKKSDDNTDR